MHIATSADALARACYNALKYAGKTDPWAMAMAIIETGCVSYLTTDGYALAWASCPADTPDITAPGVAFKVSRSDLEALELRCREGKKERVALEFDLDKHVIWYRGEDSDKDLCVNDIFEDGIEPESWDEINLTVFRELIAERALDPQARRVLLAPPYLQKIGQLKRDKDQGADIWTSGEIDPVLIKVGDGFRLAIQPIDPERHRTALGEGATW